MVKLRDPLPTRVLRVVGCIGGPVFLVMAVVFWSLDLFFWAVGVFVSTAVLAGLIEAAFYRPREQSPAHSQKS